MHHSCDYCGTSLGRDVRARFYPEDDSVLCENCFPLPEERAIVIAAPARKSPRVGRVPITLRRKAYRTG